MSPNFVCKSCNKDFKRNFCLKRHLRNVHNINVKKDTKGKFSCPICKEFVTKYGDFVKHGFEKHDISIKNVHIDFTNEDEFLLWKSSTETNTKTNFVKKYADKVKATGCKTAIFYCNRSGFFHPKPKDEERKRELKIQGSRKINGFCPCGIKVTYFGDEKVSVDYCPTHVGHKTEIAHLPLKWEESQSLAVNNIDQADGILENMCYIVGNPVEDSCCVDDSKGFKEKQATIKQVCSEDTTELESLKTRLIENFRKSILKMTSMDEIRLGEQTFKSLETKLRSVESDERLPKVQSSDNKNNQSQQSILLLKNQKSEDEDLKWPRKHKKQSVAMEKLLGVSISPDHTYSRHK